MLKDHTYKQDEAPELTKQIADRVKNRLKLLELPRYRYMVQVVVGEQRGEGVRMGCHVLGSRHGRRASERYVRLHLLRRDGAVLPELGTEHRLLQSSSFPPVSRASAAPCSTTLRAGPNTEERHCSASNAAMDFANVLASMAKSHKSPYCRGPTVSWCLREEL